MIGGPTMSTSAPNGSPYAAGSSVTHQPPANNINHNNHQQQHQHHHHQQQQQQQHQHQQSMNMSSCLQAPPSHVVHGSITGGGGPLFAPVVVSSSRIVAPSLGAPPQPSIIDFSQQRVHQQFMGGGNQNTNNQVGSAQPATVVKCCLIEHNRRCTRPASSHTYSKRMMGIVEGERLKIHQDALARHNNICTSHRRLLVSHATNAKTMAAKKANRFRTNGPGGAGGGPGERDSGSEEDNNNIITSNSNNNSGGGGGNNYGGNHKKGAATTSVFKGPNIMPPVVVPPPPPAVNVPKVKFHALPAPTLRRYKKHFKLPVKPGANKQQLGEAIYEHFQTIPVNEKETLTYFIYTVKTGRNRLDYHQQQS